MRGCPVKKSKRRIYERRNWCVMYSVVRHCSESPDVDTAAAPSWIWLVDVERACTLLIGRCLGGMLVGIPASPEEIKCLSWMNSPLFSSGAEPLASDIGSTVVFFFYLFSVFCDTLYKALSATCWYFVRPA